MLNLPSHLELIDLAVIIAYFVLVLFVALWVVRMGKRNKAGSFEDSEDYFLGGRDLSWFAIGASLFASNIGSEHLVGLAGQGASGDFVAAQFELLAALMLLLLGWVFVPFYLKSGVFTMPEFLEKRYGEGARNYLSWVSIVAYVLTKISVTIAAGAIVFTALLGIDFWTGAIVIVVITGLYTMLGGLKAVVYTDLMQMFILIGGAIALTVYGLDEIGGVDALISKTDSQYLSLWRPLSDPEFPWTGILFGAPILGVWYWCTDQFIVQRVLAAKDLSHARRGTIFAGYLKLLPMFIFVLPGVVAYVITSGPDPVFQFDSVDGVTQYDAALPLLVVHVLPAGLKGLVVAGLLAALMSSLSSVFNSCSTLFTLDIYKKYRPETSEKGLVRVGQISTLVLVILGLAWIPMLNLIEGGLFQKLQSIQAYIAPPIAAVFLFGLFVPKLHYKGAMASLVTGAVLGVFRLILELNKSSLDGFLYEIADINFLHFALLLFVVCAAVLYFVSYSTTQSEEKDVSLITYSSAGLTFNRTNVLLSVGLLILVAAIWLLF
jgi:solute:Na+ symporter, SSS family